MRVRRRHHLFRVVARDAPDEVAVLHVARRDHRQAALGFPEQPLARVQAQLRLALGRVRPVAAIAAVGEEWADVAVEVDRAGLAELIWGDSAFASRLAIAVSATMAPRSRDVAEVMDVL